MLHLISLALFNEPDDSLSNITLANYNSMIAEFRNYSGSIINQTLFALKNIINSETLVLYVKHKEVGVVGEVYRYWLKNGGTIETIFGMAVTNTRYTTVPLANENKENLEKAWFNHLTFKASSDKLNEFNAFIDATTFAFRELMLKHTTEEDEAFNQPSYLETVEKLFKEQLANIRIDDISNRTALALRLVATCRFYYTDSYKILSTINRVMEANDKVDPREAALIASIEYLADYVSAQISVGK
jgi:hypothetical protein